MIYEIPLDSDNPDFSLKVTLDEKLYEISFKWNQRAERWLFGISLDEQVLLSGLPLVSNFPFLGPYQTREDMPEGSLMLVSKLDEPGRFSLGGEAKLYYREPER